VTDSVIPGKVAVIGSGEIGAGWAALCASAGWPVAVFDTNTVAIERAFETVPRRSRALIALDRAPQAIVEQGLRELHHGRSLLQAVQDADWVIEAISEELVAKQKVWDLIEQVAGPQAICTSSSSGLSPTDIFARCRRQERCLVAHPLNPPELIPLVEVVPGTRTSPAAVAQATSYLRALGRFPIQ
jgi:3-hydroxyacyl-CoA dehydrogenase